jgi:hypothetical protein
MRQDRAGGQSCVQIAANRVIAKALLPLAQARRRTAV